MIPAALRAIRLLWRAGVNFVRDDCALLAAAIAFYSLLSLAPGLYLAGAILGGVLDMGDVSRELAASLGRYLPAEATPTVAEIEESLRFHGTLIALTIPGLLWIATTALTAFQGALDVAFARTGRWRPLVGRLKSALLLGMSVLYVALLLTSGAAMAHVGRFGTLLGLPTMPLALTAVWDRAVTPLVALTVFYLFYRILPTGRVPRPAAAAGALVAAMAWMGVRHVFGAIFLSSPAFGLVTGALAGVVAFLLWVYSSVAVVLYGAEVAALVAGDRTRAGETAPARSVGRSA